MADQDGSTDTCRLGLAEVADNVPDEWAQGFAALDPAEPPSGFPADIWRQLVTDGRRFLDRWGVDAARLNWTALDLFGVHPIAPAARYDCMGLVLLIRGGEVVSLDTTRATIRMPSGSTLTYLRRLQTGAIPIWKQAHFAR